MSLNRLWQMSYDSKLIDLMRDSKHAIPVIQSFHLFGITLLLGSMVILNFRMLGIGLRGISLDVVAKQAWSWGIGGLVLAVASGFLVFLPDPARYAANHSFVFKMCLLAVTTLFQFTLYRRIVRSESASLHPRRLVVVPLLSLAMWFGIGWAGRAIAFLG